MKKPFLTAAAALVILGACQILQGAYEMRIPKMKTPPVIDGTLSPGEWDGASAVTGLVDYYMHDLYPETMHAVWYLGYDDKNLYLAMYKRIPEEIQFKADFKKPESNDSERSVLFGDHVEIEVTPHSAEKANAGGFGFYKIMANVYGIFSDTWYNNGMPGFEADWSSGCQLKSSFKKNEWWLEIAWPLSSMKKKDMSGPIDKADGQEFIMQLVVSGSCSGYGYAGWVPTTWMEFNTFYKVTLDPEAPVFQFTKIGDIIHGQLDARIAVGAAAPMEVAMSVTDSDGKEVFRKTEAVKGRADLSFKAKDIPITYNKEATGFSKAGRNALNLNITSAGKTVYSYSGLFAGHTDEFTKQTYNEYLSSRPKGDYSANFAYYPRNGKARVSLDLDVIAELPKEVLDAKTLILRIAPRAGGKDVFRTELPIKDKAAGGLVDVGPLDGEFTAHLELADDGGKIVSSRKVDFVRKKHVWEGNDIGRERVVIPPFRAIEFNGSTLKTRCAEITIGDGGLFDKLSVLGTDLLRSPVRLSATVDGKTEALKSSPPKIEKGKGRAFPPEYDQYSFMTKSCPRKKLEELPETDGYEALISAEGSLAGLDVKTSATLDYDGHYLVNLTLDPKGGKVKLDKLELSFDLWEKARDLSILRNGGDPSFVLDGNDGIVWESRNYPPKPIGFKGTFVPTLSFSDGFHAFQFRAASDQGWLLDDGKSCQIVERKDGKLTLRLLLVNSPAAIDRPRTITFVLMPLPAKPTIPNWRSKVWEPGHYFHSAYGWRLYGTGADNWYLPTDEDYRTLGDALLHPGKYPDRCLAWQGMKENTVAQNGPILMYSSEPAVGAPLPDADSFKGQWFGDSDVKFISGDSRVGKGRNMQGTILWDKSECYCETRPQIYDQDLVDNYLWFHRKLVELADTNGTMWDNINITWHSMNDTGEFAYVRDDGHVQPTNNILVRRQLLKRLYTMGWMVGKPPLYFFKGIDEEPFSDMGWMVEGPAYIYSENGSFFDQFPTDLAPFRTEWGAGRIPVRIDSAWSFGAAKPFFADKQYRSLFALALLHDFAVSSMDQQFWEKRLRKLNETVGFMDPEKQAEFLPYFRNQEFIRLGRWSSDGKNLSFNFTQPNGVYVSIYRSMAEPRRAVLWFVNATPEDVNIGFWLDSKKLLGKEQISQCTNFDDGDSFKPHLPPTFLVGGTAPEKGDMRNFWPPVNVRSKDYRAVIME